jgi:hypothetical protein
MFFDEKHNRDDIGTDSAFCRRFPPATNRPGDFPIVRYWDWCGEYKYGENTVEEFPKRESSEEPDGRD